MSERFTFNELKPLNDRTRVFQVLRASEVPQPWRGRDVWASMEAGELVCRCTECSTPLAAMSASCAHSKALRRHLLRDVAPTPKAVQAPTPTAGVPLGDSKVHRAIRAAVNAELDALQAELMAALGALPPSAAGLAQGLQKRVTSLVQARKIKPGVVRGWMDSVLTSKRT